MTELFIAMVVGHFVGDFVFQNDWMAQNKKKMNVLGWQSATTHCLVYTITVLCFIYLAIKPELMYILRIAPFVFMSHFILDKFPVVEWYMKFFDKQNWDTHLPTKYDSICWEEKMNAEQVVSAVFGAIVYVFLDQTVHLTMLYLLALNF